MITNDNLLMNVFLVKTFRVIVETMLIYVALRGGFRRVVSFYIYFRPTNTISSLRHSRKTLRELGKLF